MRGVRRSVPGCHCEEGISKQPQPSDRHASEKALPTGGSHNPCHQKVVWRARNPRPGDLERILVRWQAQRNGARVSLRGCQFYVKGSKRLDCFQKRSHVLLCPGHSPAERSVVFPSHKCLEDNSSIRLDIIVDIFCFDQSWVPGKYHCGSLMVTGNRCCCWLSKSCGGEPSQVDSTLKTHL